MACGPEHDSSDDQTLPFDPQIHYKHPFPRAWQAWTCLNIAILIFIIIAVSVPKSPGIPFVVAYILFAISGGAGLIFFFVVDPSMGTFRQRTFHRISSDIHGDSETVKVYTIRPFFELRRCEQIGGRYHSHGGIRDCNEPYCFYPKLIGKGVERVRWERALFVMGSGEAQDRTDHVWHGTALVTELQRAQRLRDGVPGRAV